MKTHKLFLILPGLALVALLTMGATYTIRWFTDTPLTTNPTDTMAIELQSTSPNDYSYTLLRNLKRYINGSILSTNLYVTNITVNVLSSQTNNFGGIIVTNGITNLALTANTVIEADANKRLASIPNGSGVLTNDGAGTFSWVTVATLLTNISITVNNSTVTNLTVISNAYFFETNFVNYDIVTNLTVVSNAYFFETNFVNNEYVTNLYVTTNFVDISYITNVTISNAYITNITANRLTVQNFYSQTNYLGDLTVTNGITNLALTAKTQVQTDANKRLVSTPNGTGALTNNNSGDFGWFNEFASKSEVTNLVNGASNFTTLTVTNTATVNQLDYYTNAVATCDFSKGYGWTNVSAGFTFPAPINLPSPLNKASTCVVLVTNSSGTAIQIVEPANCHVVPNSVMWVTNVTSFTFFLYGNAMTNVYGIPLF